MPAQEGGLGIGVAEGGWHAAEGLIVARYFVFTQVYFHKTRVIYDHHLQSALAELLPDHQFPTADEGLDEYLRWDDWRVLGVLADGGGGDHGRRISRRDHFREITHTPETPSPDDLARLSEWRTALGDLLAAVSGREVLVQIGACRRANPRGDTNFGSEAPFQLFVGCQKH